jgi:hypothetical protein
MNTYFVGRRGEVPLRLVKATGRLDALRRVQFEHRGQLHHDGRRNPVLLGCPLGERLIATEARLVDGEWFEREEAERLAAEYGS